MFCLNRKHTLSTLAIAGVGLLTSSCGASKVAQCNELIEVINGAVADVQTVTQNPEVSSQPEALVQIADTADRAVQQMQTVELQDEQLVQYQQEFITMYQNTSSASRAIYDASQNEDLEAAQNAMAELQAATAPEPGLVNEVNRYCGGDATEAPAE